MKQITVLFRRKNVILKEPEGRLKDLTLGLLSGQVGRSFAYAQDDIVKFFIMSVFLAAGLGLAGCTHKVVGERERPVTIEAHVTIDIRGLQETASGIEDMVSKQEPAPSQAQASSEGGNKQ